MEILLTKEPTSFTEMSNIDLNNVVGKIELLDTPDGKAFQEILNTELASNIKIKPYGYCERDCEGNIVRYMLRGFSIGL